MNENELLKTFAEHGLQGFFRHRTPKIGRNFKGWPETAADGTPLQFIEDCRNQHKGEEIWILGSGPSLDDFPDDFFDAEKRIAIAVKYTRVAFPNSAYYHDTYRSLVMHVFLRNKRLHLLEKCIFALPVNCQPDWPAGYNNKPIYQRIKTGKAPIDKLIRYAMQKEVRGYIYPEFGTSLHFALEAAFILGARKITLVGCEHGVVNGRKYARKRGMSLYYWANEKLKELWSIPSEPAKVQKGTRELAQAFKLHGIETERYFYNRGYEAIV